MIRALFTNNRVQRVVRYATIAIVLMGLTVPSRGQTPDRDQEEPLLQAQALRVKGFLDAAPSAALRALPAATRLVSIELEGAAPLEALHALEVQGGFRFFYSTDLLPAEREVSLALEWVSARRALEAVLEAIDMAYWVAPSGQVVLLRKAHRAEPAPVALQAPPSLEALRPAKPAPLRLQTGTLTGTVIDSLSGETLPGVNVVIEGTTRGAATGADGHYRIPALEPGTYALPRLTGPQRFSGALVVIAVLSLVMTPLVTLASHTRTHTNLIERVFASSDQPSLTVPTQTPDTADPWAGRPRVNVLLLGGDGAIGRDGVRPDTVILASVDTTTGRTVLLSLPRNLQRFPFPENSPLHELYPQGFTGPGNRNEWLLNAIYRNVPAAHPEVFAGSSYPGADATKWAVEGALGLDVDYFVLVNLDGFEQLVDALGGITIDVRYRVPMGTKLDERTGLCTQPSGWIEPGENQRLNGTRALWYARARCGPPPVTDDYNRMERQRCVIGAIIDEAKPITLLRRYQQLAGAAEEIFQTDIPQTLLPAFVDLAAEVKQAPVASLAFTDEVIVPHSPDYDLLHTLAAEAIASSPAVASPSAPADTGAPRDEGPAGGANAAPGDTTADQAEPESLDAVC